MGDEEKVKQLEELIDYMVKEREQLIDELQRRIQWLEEELVRGGEGRGAGGGRGGGKSTLRKNRHLYAGSQEDYQKGKSPFAKGERKRYVEGVRTQADIDRDIYDRVYNRAHASVRIAEGEEVRRARKPSLEDYDNWGGSLRRRNIL